MLIFSIILISITGVLCEPRDCFEKVRSQCDYSSLPRDIPGTREELDQMCQNTTSHIKCMLEVFEDCENQDARINFLRRVIKYLEENCDTKSTVYEGISSNLECLRTASDPSFETCQDFKSVSEKRRLVALKYQEDLKIRGYTGSDDRACIEAAWLVSCSSVYIGDRCGIAARDAVLDVMMNLNVRFAFSCTEEFFDEVRLFTNLLQSAEDQEENMENAILRKK